MDQIFAQRKKVIAYGREVRQLAATFNSRLKNLQGECEHPGVVEIRGGSGFGHSINPERICVVCTLHEKGDASHPNAGYIELAASHVVKTFRVEQLEKFQKYLEFQPQDEVEKLLSNIPQNI